MPVWLLVRVWRFRDMPGCSLGAATATTAAEAAKRRDEKATILNGWK